MAIVFHLKEFDFKFKKKTFSCASTGCQNGLELKICQKKRKKNNFIFLNVFDSI